MRLAHEGLIDGNADADVYVKNISVFVDKYAKEGGKLEFFTWDGMLFCSFYKTVGITDWKEVQFEGEIIEELK